LPEYSYQSAVDESMTDDAKQFQRKRMPVHDAIRLVRDGESIIVPTGVGEPPQLLAALAEQRRTFHDVSVVQLLPLHPFDYFDPQTLEHVRHVSLFFSGATRAGGQAGWIDYIPSSFSELPGLIRDDLIPVDTVFSLASPMDQHGYFAIGLATDYTHAAIHKARKIILEVNPNVPFSFGNCYVHVSQVTAIVEDDTPVLEIPQPPIEAVDVLIGQHVAELVPDGATLQIGYGGIPSAVANQLAGKRDLGIHTEMVGDSILHLIECGAVSNRRKNFMPGRMVASFALGSQALYRYLDRNPVFEMHPVDFTNDPCIAGRNDGLIAINGSMQVDLIGQCGSESHGVAPYSGTGGQLDFARAANRSRGGKNILVLPSTARHGSVSRIVAMLSPGTHVSMGKNDVNFVVTEYGAASLRGKSVRQRASALIAIAHPDFRQELRDAARRMNIG
jgi:acyl-CoA hydrolase